MPYLQFTLRLKKHKAKLPLEYEPGTVPAVVFCAATRARPISWKDADWFKTNCLCATKWNVLGQPTCSHISMKSSYVDSKGSRFRLKFAVGIWKECSKSYEHLRQVNHHPYLHYFTSLKYLICAWRLINNLGELICMVRHCDKTQQLILSGPKFTLARKLLLS